MTGKLWLDPWTVAPIGENLLPILEKRIAEGHTIVVRETAIDLLAFRKNPDWVKHQEAQKTLRIEKWYESFDSLTAKPFRWSSKGVTTEGSESFDLAIDGFEDAKEIRVLRELIEKIGIKKADWFNEKTVHFPGKLTIVQQGLLGLPEVNTRTEIWKRAKGLHRMDVFRECDVHYCRNISLQHECPFMLSSYGSVLVV